MSRSRIALAVCLVLMLAGCGKKMFGFRRGDYPLPPPDGLQNLPQAPGYQRKLFDSKKAVADYCRAWLGPPDAYNPGEYGACVIPALKVEVLPSQAAMNDPELWKATDAHETAHEYNLVHDGSARRGWLLNGPPPAGIDPAITAALLALPKTEAYARMTQSPPARPGAMTASIVPATAPSQPPRGLMTSSARAR